MEEKGGLSFVVVAPQDPRGSWDVAALEDLIEDVLKRYWVDADRVYLTGESMGGYGAWALAAANPERFAAIVPICGGGDPASADRLRGVPTWAFHGAEDTLIRPEESRKMVAALQRGGRRRARLTIYPGIGHDAYTMTFANPRLYDWFLAHRRGSSRSQQGVTVPSNSRPGVASPTAAIPPSGRIGAMTGARLSENRT